MDNLPQHDWVKKQIEFARQGSWPEISTTGGKTPTSGDMSAITREEHDAKIEAMGARMDARFANVDAKFAGIDARFDGINTKLDVVITKSDMALEAARHAATSADDAKRAAGTTKWNILFTGIAVAGVIVALFALWINVLSTVQMFAAP